MPGCLRHRNNQPLFRPRRDLAFSWLRLTSCRLYLFIYFHCSKLRRMARLFGVGLPCLASAFKDKPRLGTINAMPPEREYAENAGGGTKRAPLNPAEDHPPSSATFTASRVVCAVLQVSGLFFLTVVRVFAVGALALWIGGLAVGFIVCPSIGVCGPPACRDRCFSVYCA